MPNHPSTPNPPCEKRFALPAGEILILLPERFTFHSHAEFRAGYRKEKIPIQSYAIDFQRTRFIDSAGLGMLLQLIEHVHNDPTRLRLINVAPEIRETLLIAGFGHLSIS